MRALGHAPEEPGEAFFSTDRRAVRERSTADAVTLVANIAALLLISLIAVPESGFEKSVIRLVDDGSTSSPTSPRPPSRRLRPACSRCGSSRDRGPTRPR